MKDLNYKVLADIATISQGSCPVKIRTCEWGNLKPRIDIRRWMEKDGEEMPLKGITLGLQEVKALKVALDGIDLESLGIAE